MSFIGDLGLPSVSDIWSANQARDNATTAYNRQRAMTEWVGSNQVQWRVNDLQKAGINPILAAGAGLGGGGGIASVASAGTPASSGFGSSQAQSAKTSASAAAKQADTQAAVGQSVIDANTSAAQASRAAADKSNAEADNLRAAKPTGDQADRGREAIIARDTSSAHSGEAASRQSDAMVQQIAATVAQLGQVLAKGQMDLNLYRQMQDLEKKIKQQDLTAKENDNVISGLKAELAKQLTPAAKQAVEDIHGASSLLNPSNWVKGFHDVGTLLEGITADAKSYLTQPKRKDNYVDNERINFGKRK
jgi:hypothetical protein